MQYGKSKSNNGTSRIQKIAVDCMSNRSSAGFLYILAFSIVWDWVWPAGLRADELR